MVEAFLHVMLTMAGGALAAAVVAWLSWLLLSWTPCPGLGPAIAFVILAFSLPMSDFAQMLLLFGGLLALAGLITLTGGSGKSGLDQGADTPPLGHVNSPAATDRIFSGPRLPNVVRQAPAHRGRSRTPRRKRGPTAGRVPPDGSLIR